jgi:hypothetical protein
MDLDKLRNVKRAFDAMSTEGQDATRADALEAKGFLADALPALSEPDRAAVAWFVAETLGGVRALPASRLGVVLDNSTSAYALAAVDLMGWLDT